MKKAKTTLTTWWSIYSEAKTFFDPGGLGKMGIVDQVLVLDGWISNVGRGWTRREAEVIAKEQGFGVVYLKMSLILVKKVSLNIFFKEWN
jgi:hypothetical protein